MSGMQLRAQCPAFAELLALSLATSSYFAMMSVLIVCLHEHPVVLPHVSHFMQVPLRTSVEIPALAAHLALVALGLGFRPAFGL